MSLKIPKLFLLETPNFVIIGTDVLWNMVFEADR